MFIINGRVKHLKKYGDNEWHECRSDYEKGRCASIVEYKSPLKSSEEEVNYVIIACNRTLESITENCDTVSGSELSMNKIYEWFSNQGYNYRLQLFLMDADAPIREDAKLLAQYIDTLAINPKTKSVSLIGISECGAMSFYVPRFFASEDSYEKTNVITVGTPFNGTITHSPQRIYELIEDRINDTRFGDTIFTEKVSGIIKSVYRKMRIASHRFYDVALRNAIPNTKLKFYDASFIREIFLAENLRAIEKLQSYKNFVLRINDEVIAKAIRSRNITSLKNCLMDRILFDGKDSDGMVSVESQKTVKYFLGEIGMGEVLYATNNVLEEDAFNQILSYVSGTIKKQVSVDEIQKRMGMKEV